MHDPLLGGVGVMGCHEGRRAVESYLGNRSLPPFDAVLSSVLARAMETALLTFPQQAAPLYVVPFIREHARGLSNDPKEPAGQLADLRTSVPYDFHLDYRWVEQFGSEKGSWDQFLHFLEQSFLPDLVSRLRKPPGSQIVLPVVTHSKFMRDSDVGVKCADAFEPNPSKKPLNNQVVEITYAFHSGEAASRGLSSPSVPRAETEHEAHPEPGEEASSLLFTVTECGEPRAVGQWRLAGTHEGRPAYASLDDAEVLIRWSEDASAWQLVTSSSWLFSGGDTVLYESRSEGPFDPRSFGPQWEIATGRRRRPRAKAPVPRVVWKDRRYSLRETSSPCENIYPGVKLTDFAGNPRVPICLKDVGESCIEPIKKYSWAPGVLWQQTYEGMIDEENRTIAQLQDRVASQRQDIEEKHLQLAEESDPRAKTTLLKGIEATEELVRRNEQKITRHEASRAALADATCWSGGKPNASRGNVGREG